MSDRIAVMLDGRVEQLADPDTIYDHPATAFVAGFIGKQNFFEGTARETGRVVEGDGWTFRATAEATDVVEGGEALAAVRPEAIVLSETQPDNGENAISGTLASISHLGDVIQFVVMTPGRKEIIARLPRPARAAAERGHRRVVLLGRRAHAHVRRRPGRHRSGRSRRRNGAGLPPDQEGEARMTIETTSRSPNPRVERDGAADVRGDSSSRAGPWPRSREGSARRVWRRRDANPSAGGAPTGSDRHRRARGPAELLPLGRVRRPRAVRAVHRRVRPHHEDRHLRLERGGDRQAHRGAGHGGLRHRRADRRLHPADGRERPARRARPREDPELRQHRDRLHEPALGPGQRCTPCARTGARPAGSSTRGDRTPIATWKDFIDGRDGRGEREASPCWTRRTSCAASTSGPTGSTGRPRTRPTSTPTRSSWSTSSRRTSRRSTRTRASRSPRATTCSPRCGTATPVRV